MKLLLKYFVEQNPIMLSDRKARENARYNCFGSYSLLHSLHGSSALLEIFQSRICLGLAVS